MPRFDDTTEPFIRPIRPDDDDRLRASHARLSPDSQYRRFLATKPELTRSDARYLVDIDGCDHFALVATLPAVDGEPIVAVARYVRLADDREVAEMAVVVGDAHQRGGLGAQLVRRLAQAAVERGVKRFRATMLTQNLGIQRLLEGLATGAVRRRWLGDVVELELDLPGAEHAGPDCGPLAAVAGA